MSTCVMRPSDNDTVNIQNALNSCGDFGVVELSEGDYHITKSLLMPSTTSLIGLGHRPDAVVLHATGAQFPLIVRVPPQHMTVPVDRNAFVMDGTQNYWVNLSADCWFARGFSNIVPWECSFDIFLDSLPTDERTIIASQGLETMYNESYRQAFGINVYTDTFRVYWNWDGTRHLQSVSGIVAGTWINVKMRFDGTNMTFSLDGVVKATEAAGPIQQSYHEDICIGALPYRWPDGSVIAPMVNGKIRNIHITGSGIGNGTIGDIAPKFDECDGPLVPIDTGFGRHLTVIRYNDSPYQAPVYIKNLQTNAGTGIFLDNAVNSVVEDVECFFGGNGVYMWNNCYKSVLRNIRVISGRFGVAWVGACNLMKLEDFQIQGCDVGIIASDGGGHIMDGFIYGGGMYSAVICKGDWPSITLDNISFGDEGQTAPIPAHGILASHVRGLTIIGCAGVYFNFAVPPLTIDNCDGVSVVNMLFGLNITTSSLAKLNGPEAALFIAARIGANNVDISNIPIYTPLSSGTNV